MCSLAAQAAKPQPKMRCFTWVEVSHAGMSSQRTGLDQSGFSRSQAASSCSQGTTACLRSGGTQTLLCPQLHKPEAHGTIEARICLITGCGGDLSPWLPIRSHEREDARRCPEAEREGLPRTAQSRGLGNALSAGLWLRAPMQCAVMLCRWTYRSLISLSLA